MEQTSSSQRNSHLRHPRRDNDPCAIGVRAITCFLWNALFFPSPPLLPLRPSMPPASALIRPKYVRAISHSTLQSPREAMDKAICNALQKCDAARRINLKKRDNSPYDSCSYHTSLPCPLRAAPTYDPQLPGNRHVTDRRFDSMVENVTVHRWGKQRQVEGPLTHHERNFPSRTEHGAKFAAGAFANTS